MNWWQLGRCAEVDPEIFFPDKGESTRDAKRVCFTCEVRAECLAYAMDDPSLIGVWGGMSYTERRVMRHGQVAA